MVKWIVASSLFIAIILILRFILKGKISLRLQYALWGLVLLRLLNPFSIGSSNLSVMNTAENIPVVQDIEQMRGVETIWRTETGSVEGYPHNAYMPETSVPIAPSKTEAEFARMERVLAFRNVFVPVWLCGAAVLFTVFAGANMQFLSRLHGTRKQLEGYGSVLPVYMTDAAETPCLFGLFHPAIYVTPEAAEDTTVLRHIVEHETTHFRHGDHLWSLLRGVCLALHWYNPLVWLAAILSRDDAELACDEATINRIGESERAEYGRTLIGITCQKRTALLITATTMTGSKNRIKERIMLIAKRPKTASYTLVSVVLVAAIAVGCTFTGAKGDSEVAIQVDAQVHVPDAVLEYAREYVRRTMAQYAQLGTNPPDGAEPYRITDAKISGLTQMNTGTAWQNNSINLYRLEYRLRPDHPDNVVLAGGRFIEDGWITEWGSTGQPYLLLSCDDSGPQPVWQFICSTNTDAITDYGTPEMLEKYEDAYTAAAMELYRNYRDAPEINSLSSEQVAQVNEAFAPTLTDSEGTVTVNPISCFFTSYYDNPADINLAEFLQYVPNGSIVTEKAEFDALRNLSNWPYEQDSVLANVPIHKYRSEVLNQTLLKYAGISLDDLSGVGFDEVLYLKEYDAYYNFTSDFGPGTFHCVRGEVVGDTVRLYSEYGSGGGGTLTLQKQNGRYLIVSHQETDGTSDDTSTQTTN